MTEIPKSKLRREDVYIRAFAIMAAGVLLNIGLFFVLGILTSLFVGVIIGYIIGEQGTSPTAAGLSAVIAYSIMFPITNVNSNFIIVIEAILGLFGGYFGHYIRKKSVNSAN